MGRSHAILTILNDGETFTDVEDTYISFIPDVCQEENDILASGSIPERENEAGFIDINIHELLMKAIEADLDVAGLREIGQAMARPIVLRDFDEDDWDCYGGAHGFDICNPLIADIKIYDGHCRDCQLIFCKTDEKDLQIQIHEELNDKFWRMVVPSYTVGLAFLKNMSSRCNAQDLRNFGFMENDNE